MIDDPKIIVGSLVDDLRIIYKVEVNLHKVYRAKKKILESITGKDHVESFK